MSWTAVTNGVTTQTGEIVSPFDYETYVGHSGNTTGDYSIGFNNGEGYRCAVVSNRRMFVGNVRRRDKNGNARIYEDRVCYSPANKLDTFPATNYLDLGFNDGQAITALSAYGDRLFVFKDNTLYIVNIAGGVDTQWQLEGSYNNYGVSQPCNVIQTDIGVVWVNANGLFLFDGNRINNLIDGKIEPSEWYAFVQSDSIVAYYQPTRKIMVMKTASGTGSDDARTYVYNIRTQAFSIMELPLTENYSRTNAINDVYGNAFIMGGVATPTTYTNGFNKKDQG